MNKTNICSTRSSLRKSALIALGFALSLVLIPIAALNAAPAEVTPAKSLPLAHAFSKTAGEKGPHELKLTNTSKASLKVSVKILLSVYSHASDKARVLPAQTIEAGKDWTISQLAALDKVIITAEGYAPLGAGSSIVRHTTAERPELGPESRKFADSSMFPPGAGSSCPFFLR